MQYTATDSLPARSNGNGLAYVRQAFELLREGYDVPARYFGARYADFISPMFPQIGNGQPVLLVPGFGAGDWTMWPLGTRLEAMGFRVYYLGLRVNTHFGQDTADLIRTRTQEIVDETGMAVIMIGHSLGGLQSYWALIDAQEEARRRATEERVAKICALGSPLQEVNGEVPVHAAVNRVYRRYALPREFGFREPLRHAVAKQRSAISGFTKFDRIVHWSASARPDAMHFEMSYGGHGGLPNHPEFLDAIKFNGLLAVQ